jgi:hypothetical protein
MIYLERICNDLNVFAIERQKDTPKGEWYGISLMSYQKCISDNDEWIYNNLMGLLKTKPPQAMDELGLSYNKKEAVTIYKILRKADKLGWFDHLKK